MERGIAGGCTPRRVAAIHDEKLPRHVAGVVRSEKQNGIGDFFHAPHTPHWKPSSQLLQIGVIIGVSLALPQDFDGEFVERDLIRALAGIHDDARAQLELKLIQQRSDFRR